MDHKSSVRKPHKTTKLSGGNPRMYRQKEEGFFGQSFDYRNYVFSPEGYEGVALTFYILAIPYLMGLMALYLFVAGTNFEYFVEFDLASFFVIWAMGYEVCGVTVIAGIFIAWLNYSHKQKDSKQGHAKHNPRNRHRF